MVNVILVSVLATLGGVAVGLAVRRLIVAWERRAQAMEALSKSMVAASTAMETLPKMVEGLIKVSQDQVEQLTVMTEAVQKFSRMIYSGGGSDGYLEHSDDEKNKEYEIQDLMERGGITREQAQARINERDVYRNFRVTP